MDSRLTKALMGLGGTGAAAGGGLYLNDFLTRRKLFAEEEKRASALDVHYKSKEDDGFDRYAVRSYYQDVFWESNGILKVESAANPNYTYTFQYEKNEMENKEKELWEKIKGEKKILNDVATLAEIDSENVEYWKKYKKVCEKGNPTGGSEKDHEDNSMCVTGETEEQFLKRSEYEKYLKAKEQNANLSLREFYGTVGKKFSKDCNQAMISDTNNSPNKISAYYDKGKADSNACATR